MAIGFNAETLERAFEIKTDDEILSTAICPTKGVVALFDRSGSVSLHSLVDKKRLGTFAVGTPRYAQAWMRFEFNNKGDSLFFLFHSLRNVAETVTEVYEIKSGKLTHSCNSWYEACKERIRDAALMPPQDDSQLLLVTPRKGIYLAATSGRDVKLLCTPRGRAYVIHTFQAGKRRIGFVCTEDSNLQIYDLDNGRLRDTVALPKGYVRSLSVSPDQGRLALVVSGEGGENLVVVDSALDKE
jgi:hypothetical protein